MITKQYEKIRISPRGDYHDNEQDYFIFACVLEQKHPVSADPFTSLFLSILRVKKGYAIEKDCYAVLETSQFEGHPSYSDSVSDKLFLFDSYEEATSAYDARSAELDKLYPR
jgi:hypothetical protein